MLGTIVAGSGRAERAEETGGASASSPDGDGVRGRSPRGMTVRAASRRTGKAGGRGRHWADRAARDRPGLRARRCSRWATARRALLEPQCHDLTGAGDEPATAQRHLDIGQAALERLGFPWRERLPGWTITFLQGGPALLGGTWTYQRRIEIYVRETQSVDDVAFTLAHELGHAIDVTCFGETERIGWLEARGLDPATPWWVASGATDFASGAGDWAEAFAIRLLGGAGHSRVAGQPDTRQLDLAARLSGALLGAS